MYRTFLSLLLLCLCSWTLSAQLILRISELPASTPDPVTLYVAGNFNGWAPGNADYQMKQNADGKWELRLDLAAATYEYKITRGDWATVEGTAQGNNRPNRSVTYAGGEQVEAIAIAGWEDGGGGGAQPSTAAENVTVLDAAFYMPQLDRHRRIMLYLPPDYAISNRRYPVLYMHDGQNLFDMATSFSGEWEVDETLNALHAAGDPGVIVVGIDNGGSERINELTPYANARYGGGRGDDYVDFIVETLKPHVDANFRTLDGAEHTGIMGSSLGGLITLYAAAKYPQVFGRAGVFSPSLWYTGDIYDFVAEAGRQAPQRYYFLAGYGENSASNRVTDDVVAMAQLLSEAGFSEDELRTELHQDGQHSEWYWAREFSAAYQWLFAEMPSQVARFTAEPLNLWPVPARDTLHLTVPGPAPTHGWLYDQHGRSLGKHRLESDRLNVGSLPAGVYWLRLRSGKRQWVGRFVKVE
ncbi:metallo-beta-lactamase class B [Lewinella marina]|uniref:Phosphonate ABC transporter ATP-binding protein n=1 Tax=Neolewinella marina TaxID=438751 RepID=A0A2G0CKE8_9BACT|nr:alpha/beta hydrolase-fold protein [Neolewinella marina]NJB84355.1 metallo-beta-lactamase class B [Neolewinella marina]PHL00446.1 phosphonate ABC transporter ATP-binding protein [Neolewinella marina]